MQTLFYFQAEDGIRDDLVTGVQTCALPIWVPPARADGLDLLPQRLGANRLEDEALAVGGAVDAGRQLLARAEDEAAAQPRAQRGRFAPEPLAAVQLRVGDHDVEGIEDHRLQPFDAARRDLDRAATVPQKRGQALPQLAVVVHHENGEHVGCRLRGDLINVTTSRARVDLHELHHLTTTNTAESSGRQGRA